MKPVALLPVSALLWAQAVQIKPRLERAPRAKVYVGSYAGFRTANLPWLQPNQDYAIVPSSTNDPDYAGDTLLSNGTGPNTRSNPPAACVGTFFDSLEANAAYPFVGNERFKLGSGITSIGIAPYYDGAIAERYDITPDRDGTNRTVSIKGVAALLINIPASSSSACQPTLADPSPGQGLNEYTFTYAIHAVRPFTYRSPFYNPPRNGTIPVDTSIRRVEKPKSQIRLANLLLGDNGSQCPQPQATPPSITEIFDFAYFSQPLDITDSASYYVVASTERYNINTYNLTDTIYFFYGPATAGSLANHPCYNGDTVRIGRSLISWGWYDTTASGGNFFGPPSSLSSSLPDWLPTHLFSPPIDQGLNWVVFPIVYAQDVVTGVWLHGAKGDILTPYPNPATECFHLKVRTGAPTTMQFYLYTLDGRLVHAWPERELPAGENAITLDVGSLPAGSYLLRAHSDLVHGAFHVTILH